MKSKRFISLSLMLGLTTGMFVGLHQSQRSQVVVEVDAASWTAYTHYDGATYYNGISDTLTGSGLTSALRTLNNSKKKNNGGYTNLLKNDFWAKYTDFDSSQSYSQDTTHNLPYSTKIVSFYSGNVSNNAEGMNREHVWPNSKGGNLVENDSHMARPTLTSENSSRGNSFYVQGMKSTSLGWDPAMETWGDETYRGDAARIIFYCAMANGSLTLVDKEKDANANKTMGKLSDMLRWNLTYGVKKREMNRNEAVEAIQGNRNPFIDHPEYACRIWGETNNETRQICGQVVPALTISASSLSIANGGTAQISATSSTGTSITWETSNASVCSISSTSSASGAAITLTGASLGTAKITAQTVIEGQTLLRECNVTVSGAPTVNSVSLDKTSLTLDIDKGYELKLIPDPSDATLPEFTWTSSNEQVATVSSKGLVMARGVGSAVITAKSTNPAFTLTCNVTVSGVPTVNSVSLDKTSLTLDIDKGYELKLIPDPSDATLPEFTWTSSNEQVATVSSSGLVMARGVGSAVITAKSTNPAFSLTCNVTVVPPGGPSSGGGCGGNIITTSVILSTLSVLGIGLILIKRKFIK